MRNERLELVLSRLHQRAHCLLVGNGTAGIYLAIRALGLSGARIALSNSVCPNVPIAIYLAGATPAFCDISTDSLCLDIQSLAPDESVAAVIGVHAYGVPCDVAALEAFCVSQHIPFIEDAAVAQGATALGKPAGSFGAASILSFGAGKVVSAGIGGALLTDDASLYRELVQLEAELPDFSETSQNAISELGRDHTALYNQVYLAGNYGQLPQRFKLRALAAGSSFLHRFPANVEAEVLNRVLHLETIVDNRRRNTSDLANRLRGYDDLGVGVFQYPDGSVPWRFNLLINNRRDELLQALLREGFKVSSWYPSADLFFETREQSSVRTPVADSLSARILNVWVDESIDTAYLQTVSRRIIEFLTPERKLE